MLFRGLKRRISLEKCIELEKTYGCWNYNPLPVCLERGEGVYVWDTSGKKYFDCLSAYGAVNQGHCHPEIKKALIAQMDKITLTSRAFFNDLLGETCQLFNEVFQYDRVILANSGVEAGETAIKFARKWGYVNKGVRKNKATVLFASENFWGRTITACGSSDDPERFQNFGPYGKGMTIIRYGDIMALEEELINNPDIVAYMVEPIQGEAGIIIPPNGYLEQVRQLCTKHNVLLIVDEIQTGMGRTGKMLCSDWYGIKADMVCLGKALSGGFFPISAVLGTNEVFDCIKAGDHGSTFGGSPLACAVAKRSIEVLIEEEMVENSRVMGQKLLDNMQAMLKDKLFVKGNKIFQESYI